MAGAGLNTKQGVSWFLVIDFTVCIRQRIQYVDPHTKKKKTGNN